MYKTNFDLYDYQKEGVEYISKAKYCLLADGMGLGKSIQSIYACTANREVRRILIICPSYLKSNWKKEIKKTFQLNLNVKILSKKEQIDEFDYICIISFDMLAKNNHLFAYFDAIIIDESHYLKNPLTKRYTAVYAGLKKFTPKMLVLCSGTPIENNASEFFSPLTLLSLNPHRTNGKKLGDYYANYTYFQRHFCYVVTQNIRGRRFNKVHGSRNEEELKEFLESKMLRRRSEDVLDLPPIIRKEVQIKVIAKYDDKLLSAWEKFENGKMDSQVIKAKVNSSMAKVDSTIKFVTEIFSENKESQVLVFGEFIEPLNLIHARLSELEGVNVALVNGKVLPDARQAFVDQFQDGKINCIVATIKSFNTGFNLTKCQNIVFHSQIWKPTENEQAIARAHRIGNDQTVNVFYIIGSYIDRKIKRILEQKNKVLGEFLG